MAFVLRLRRDDGFMMVELLMAITVMAIALTTLVAVYSSGIIGMGKSSDQTTATLLADAQMESYHIMVYRDIGLDLGATALAALDSTYKSDSACANTATSTTCNADGADNTETEPTGSLPDSCTSINTWYPNTDPCVASRSVNSGTTPASPDGHSYRVDTYVILVPAVTSTDGGQSIQDAYKRVTVVVRNGNQLSTILARESSDFACATGQVPGDTTDC